MEKPQLRQHIEEDLKSAMRAKNQVLVTTIRMLLAAIKQREIDERITLDEPQIVSLINKMIKQRKEALALYKKAARDDLIDPLKNSFIIVMIPEEMAISETGRLINELLKYQIPNSNIVINQLYQDDSELCEFCKSRRGMQQRNLAKIKEIFGERLGKSLIEVPLFKEEIREYKKLKEMGEYLIK